MTFLMLIKVTALAKGHPSLIDWMDEIETDYMDRFGELGPSVAHLALEGPWDFALVFPGSSESATYLAKSISARAPGETEILTLQGVDLDEFRESRRA